MTDKTKSKYTKNSKSSKGNVLELDGVSHINIHSVGRTELGRALSHFAHTPFVHPYFGPFYSMEGCWYWCRSNFSHDTLRYLSGLRAKKVGKELEYVWYKNFKEDIVAANYQKIIQHDEIREMMIESTLPFDHYYVFPESSMIITPKSTDWLLEGFEHIRMALKEGVVPSIWTAAEKRYLEK